VEQLLAQAVDHETRATASARLQVLLARLGTSRVLTLRSESQYFERLVQQLERKEPGGRP
jgi:hypothetical protein